MTSTHETIASHDEVEEPSNRSFGLTVGGILIAIGAIRSVIHSEVSTANALLIAVGSVLVICAFVAPSVLSPLNHAWMKLGVLLARLVNPLIMFLVFSVAVVPTALIRRLLGKDSLGLHPDPVATSYWHVRKPEDADPARMKNQF